LLGVVAYRTDDSQKALFGGTRGDLAATEQLTDYLPTTPLVAGRNSIANVVLVDDSRHSQVVRQQVDTRTTSYGVFGALQYSVSEQVRLRGELRTQRDRVALDSSIVNFRSSFGRQISPADFNQWTARASIDADLADGVFGYVSAARGSRPGGINPGPGLPAGEQTYEPESNWTYELGARHERDGWLAAIAGTVYYVDWSDTQINGLPSRPGSSSIIVVNTAGIETWGVALSATLRPSEWYRLELAYNYARPRFTDGSDDPGSSTFCGLSPLNDRSTLCRLGPPRHPNPNSPALVPWLDGNAPGRAPATTWHAALIARSPDEILGMRPWARVDANYQSSVYERQIDGAQFGQRALLDARLGLSRERWSVELWGTNLTDSNYVRASFSRLPAFYPTQPRPLDLIFADGRRYGLTIRWVTD
jgi:iron complex outermembrane receptor protein